MQGKKSLPSHKNNVSLKDSALEYARQGFAVFPCLPKGKAPFGGLVPSGHKEATTDSKRITTWWNLEPKANIGWVPPKATLVLDVDPRNGGLESLKSLNIPHLNETLQAKTGGGGFHFIFNQCPDRVPGKLGPGLDIKANAKGYVIVAPSLHESGKRYSWVQGFHQDRIQPWAFVPPPVLSTSSDLTREQIRKLLNKIPSDAYETWISVGQILKQENSNSVLLWDTWSRTSSKYPGLDAIKKKWFSFKGSGRNIGTLIHLAGGRPPRPDAKEEFEKVEQPPSKIQFRHISEIVSDRREPRWLLDDVIEAQVLGVLAGPRGSFKSFIALEWAMRVAVNGHGVIILSGEGAGLDRRTDAWVRTHARGHHLPNLPVLALERVLNLNENEIVSDLVKAIKQCAYEIKMVVVDTLSKYSPGADENDNTEMARYLSRLAVKIRDLLGITVLLVAHSGHSDPNRPRGASALMANPDVEYIVSRPDPKGMFVSVSRERFKDTPSLPKLTYLAEVIDLDRVDSRLQAVTSLALRLSDSPLNQKIPRGGVQKTVWGVVKEMLSMGVDMIDVSTVIDEAVQGMVFDPKGGARDIRRRSVIKAIDTLVVEKYFALESGKLSKI